MTFFHYTYCRHLQNILEEGLKPVPEGEGNWKYYNNPLLTFPPDNVVWLTTRKTAPAFFSELLLGDFTGDVFMRIAVGLSPNCRRLHRWEPWLRKHDPLMYAVLDTEEIDEDGWREHWFHVGTITPDKIEGVQFDPEIG
jgi:hypothetical protein